MEICNCEKAYFKSEVGMLKILCCLNGVHSICILPYDVQKEENSKMSNLGSENRKNAMKTVTDWLKSYFAASIEDIKHLPPVCPAIFSDKGDFTVKVWKTLMTKVGFGETISYGQLATLSGNNAASRAVGSAMKHNDIPIIIPCHRVIKSDGNHGCDGGWMDYAFQYVIDNNGIDTEIIYPYKAKKRHCKFVQSGVGANCTRYVRIEAGREKYLQAAVANIGPISVAIDAGEDKFMSYKEGIYYDKTCTSEVLDHAVLVVGYGTLNGTDYWIVKNSWGTSWGMNGYILMARNAHNMCGIASHAVYPVL